jgi:hypothetical protein
MDGGGHPWPAGTWHTDRVMFVSLSVLILHAKYFSQSLLMFDEDS